MPKLPSSIDPTMNRHQGATRADVIVGVGCAAIAFSVAIPVLARNSVDSGEARSLSNLRVLAAAHEAYSQTFSGKQLGVIPEDAGLVNGNCAVYVSTIACPPQLLLGLGSSGGWWGYFLGSSGFCAQGNWPGNCGNWVAYKPLQFTGADAGFGSFRLGNAVAFNSFVDGRFYSDTFYSPNDRLNYETSARYRDEVVQFESFSGEIALSSYCLSPAAMYHPGVLAHANDGYKDPNTFPEAYVSPTVSQCAYPELKTRMIEHQWNVGAPSFGTNVGTSIKDAWLFNSSALASPNGFFFDGHVSRVSNAQAIADDKALFDSTGQRLWSRTTPLGELGYRNGSATEGERTSHTILTIDGILGRDLLTP
jgi:hypothetical protein